MDGFAGFLRGFFTGCVYPAVIILTCVVIFGTVAFVTLKTKAPRVIIAALLPLAALPFLLISYSPQDDPLVTVMTELSGVVKFLAGAFVAIFLIEVGRHLLETESEVAAAVFVLFVGSVGAFVLYAIMATGVIAVHVIFFGFVVGGGVYMIFRGVPLPADVLRGWPFHPSDPS